MTDRDLLASADPATFADEATQETEDRIGLDKGKRRDVQRRLTGLGFDTKVNGRFDKSTRAVITRWQVARGYPKTGFLNTLQHQALLTESVFGIGNVVGRADDVGHREAAVLECGFNGLEAVSCLARDICRQGHGGVVVSGGAGKEGEIAIDDGAAIAGCFLEGRAGGNQAAGHHVHLGDGTSCDRIEWHAMPFLQRMICRSVSGSAKRSCAGLIIQSAIGRKTGFHFC